MGRIIFLEIQEQSPVWGGGRHGEACGPQQVCCAVLWCDVMCCDVMWCGVMWCDVMYIALLHQVLCFGYDAIPLQRGFRVALQKQTWHALSVPILKLPCPFTAMQDREWCTALLLALGIKKNWQLYSRAFNCLHMRLCHLFWGCVRCCFAIGSYARATIVRTWGLNAWTCVYTLCGSVCGCECAVLLCLLYPWAFLIALMNITRVGQNRICEPYMTVYLLTSLLKTRFRYRFTTLNV